MLLLDTDISSPVEENDPAGLLAMRRVLASGQPYFLAVPTVEERLRGRFAYCAGATPPEQYAAASGRLRKTLVALHGFALLDFDARAAAEFTALKAAEVRTGTQDLRIAAVALAHDALLLTRNRRDFHKVPGLRAEDWTV